MKEAFTGASVDDLKPVAAELSPEDPAGPRPRNPLWNSEASACARLGA